MKIDEFLRFAHSRPFDSISALEQAVNANLIDKGVFRFASMSLSEEFFVNISSPVDDVFINSDEFDIDQLNIQNYLCNEISNSVCSVKSKFASMDSEIDFFIDLFLKDIFYKRLSHIRDSVVEASYRSKDFNSFAHRLIDGVARPYFNVEGCSLYALDPRNGFLRLAATTGLKGNLEKKDVFYPEGHGNRPFDVLRSGKMKCFQGENVIDTDTYKEKVQSGSPYSILFVPIRRMRQNERNEDRQMGVLKLINPRRRLGDEKQSHFHRLDRAELNFFAETVSVLSQNYNRALEAEDNFERTIHGFRTDLESSADHLDTLGHLVFEDRDISPKMEKIFDESPFSIGEIRRLHEDALAFLDDLSFQIEKARLLTHEKNELIQHFHAEVLAPVLKMVGSMVVSNSSLPPDINKLIEVGSLDLPEIIGSASGYISVLRNLIENAIKYRKPNKVPKIRVSFHSGVEFVEMHVRDFGIGIRQDEERFLFVEGFRSVAARRATFKGAGIGLSYSRDVMRIMGGDLEYRRVGDGMDFVVKMPRPKRFSTVIGS